MTQEQNEQVYIRPVVKQGKRGRYWFTLEDESGKKLAQASPPGFATRDDAWRAIHKLSATLWLLQGNETDEEETGFLDDMKGWLGL